jgi:hypothetical protein
MRGNKGQTYEDWIGSASWKDGQGAEKLFGDLVRGKYPEIRQATLQEQYKHIDWVCSAGTIDVKAIKRKSRGGDKSTDFIWVEFKNNAGDKGWLYGEQDFIAFELDDSFVVVRRIALCELCEQLCETNKKVAKALEALYKGYTRRNRSDLISMIRTDDLFRINHSIIQKTCLTFTNTIQANQNSSAI